MFVLVEGFEAEMLNRWFKTRGELVELPRGEDIENGGVHEQRSDVERFISMMAVSVLIANWDDYTFGHNNFRIYLEGLRETFLVHDLDGVFVADSGGPGPAGELHPEIRGRVARNVMAKSVNKRKFEIRLRELWLKRGPLEKFETQARWLREQLHESEWTQFDEACQFLAQRIKARCDFLETYFAQHP